MSLQVMNSGTSLPKMIPANCAKNLLACHKQRHVNFKERFSMPEKLFFWSRSIIGWGHWQRRFIRHTWTRLTFETFDQLLSTRYHNLSYVLGRFLSSPLEFLTDFIILDSSCCFLVFDCLCFNIISLRWSFKGRASVPFYSREIFKPWS